MKRSVYEVISCIGVSDFVPGKQYFSPALIHASSYDMYDSSKFMWRVVSATYENIISVSTC